MRNSVRHGAGYALGFCFFSVLIPYGLWRLSTSGYWLFEVPVIPHGHIRIIVSSLLFVIGLIFTVWSNVFLLFKGKGGPVDIAGVSISPRTKKLVREGPYKYTRNPMVFGINTIYLAMAVYLDSLGCLLVWIIFFVVLVRYAMAREETRLLKDFGADYVEYKRTTPRIIPWPKRRR